jgi:hypothetical protein
MISNSQKGALLILVLIFGSVFFVMISGFLGYVITQYQSQEVRIQKELAREIAEAGLNYYKWFLAHYPGDVTHGTGNPGPFTIPFNDPELGKIGEFTITLNSTAYCGAVSSIDITSTGRTDAMPNIERTVYARYARPTVAEYSFILNSSVWAGPDRIIIGPYHSNGGIRMDGTNNSTVTSQLQTWQCTPSFNCTPTVTRNGVFTTTANPNTALFSFPSTPINFTGLTLDLEQMRIRAINNGGIFIPRSPSGNFGYRIQFNSNDTITVRRVTQADPYWGYSTEFGWQQERNVINSSTLVGTYPISPTCPLIFVDDKVWLEGQVNQRVTIAAASTTSGTLNPSIIINNNITYTSATSAGLLAVAEQDVLVGLDVPTNLTANGIYIAKDGRFSRNRYCTNCNEGGNRGLPSSLDPFVARNSMSMTGTIVSNARVGTQWVDQNGDFSSGFLNRYNSFDRNLVDNPPPLTPNTSDDYVFTEWRDEY